MQKMTLTKIARAALVPAVALGLSISVQAQSSTANSSKQSSASATPGQPSQNTSYRGLRASEVIGKSVRNSQDKDVGKIEDLIVDMNSGQVRYAVLSFDPGILSAEKLFAVPTTELRMAKDRDDLVYDVSRDKLERATVDRSEWKQLSDEDRVARVDKAWGLARPGSGAHAKRASDLLGKDVNSPSGEKIGEIEELVVNMAQQKVHYAVMQFDPGWTSPEQRYVFPLRSFTAARDKDELVLDVDKSRIQAMKSFDRNIYSNLNDRSRAVEIDRYFVNVLPMVVATRSGSGDTTQSSSVNRPQTQTQARTDTQAQTRPQTQASTDTRTQSRARADTDSARMGAGSQASSFNDLDTNRNGWLDRDEMSAATAIDRDWTTIDRNRDGRVSRQEFASATGTRAARQDRN